MLKIKRIHDLIDIVLSKRNVSTLSRGDKDKLIYDASLELFSKYVDEYETTSQINDSLLPFKIDPTELTVTKKFAKLPSNYDSLINVYTSDYKQIDIVPSQAWATRKHSTLLEPTEDYPICIIRNDRIEVEPDLDKILLEYFKLPQPPVFGLNTQILADAGREVYDESESTDIEWGDDEIDELVTLALEKIGIGLKDAEVSQFVNLKKQIDGINT